MLAYIEIVSPIAVRRRFLNDSEQREIGAFTRGNVQRWVDSREGFDWLCSSPAVDFYATNGITEIPWATEEHNQIFYRCYPPLDDVSNKKVEEL